MGSLGDLSGWFDDWGKDVISQGFNFGNTFLQSHYAAQAARYQAPGASLVPYTGQQPYPQTPNPNTGDEYGSGGVSSAGIRIGGTLVTWPTLALGVGALMLIQMRPVGRR